MLECWELFAFWARESLSLRIVVVEIIPEKSLGVLLSLLKLFDLDLAGKQPPALFMDLQSQAQVWGEEHPTLRNMVFFSRTAIKMFPFSIMAEFRNWEFVRSDIICISSTILRVCVL